MLGIIDVGGGNRGAFGAGVLDYCMDHGIMADYCIGVSAGSANCVSYIAGQRGRNYRFYTKYNISDDAISLKNRLTNHALINLDYIFSTVSNDDGADPLDYTSFAESSQKCFIVATDAESGKPVYFTKKDIHRNDYRVLAASCNLPAVNCAYEYNHHRYFDGGLSDPIPVEKAFRDGCDKVIVILTLPKTYFRNAGRDRHLARLVRSCPNIRAAFESRAALYNAQLNRILEYEKENKVLIIAPKSKPELDTLGKDKSEITRVYEEGYEEASRIPSFLD